MLIFIYNMVMHMHKIINFTVFLLLCLASYAQAQVSETPTQFVYRKEWSGGATINNRGFGGILRHAIITNNFKKIQFEIELVKLKHPKEIKVVNPYYDNAKSYVYGKQNAFYPLRLGVGTQFLIFDKAAKEGVEISFNIMAGTSIGLLKPIYLEILKDNGNPFYLDVVSEKFNKDLHNPGNIYGYSGFNKGLNETSILLGGYIKSGFTFDWSNKDEKIVLLETGAVIDFYSRKVPIMANFSSDINKSAFISLYASILFGKKY